jgi:predicted RNA-binding protein
LSVVQIAHSVERPVWLLITGHGSWYRLRELGEWAFPDKALAKVAEIEPGDIAVVYLTQDGGDCGLGGGVRFGEGLRKVKAANLFDTMYPHRMPIAVVKAPVAPVPFRPLIQDIAFIKNKQNWGLYFQGHPLRSLPAEDAATLLRAVGLPR